MLCISEAILLMKGKSKKSRRSFIKKSTALLSIPAIIPASIFGMNTDKIRSNKMNSLKLTTEHTNAAARQRRIVVNLDAGWGLPGVEDMEPAVMVDANIEYLTSMHGSQVDSIWWCWGEMNFAPYPSKILPVRDGYQQWIQQELDPLPVCIEKCRNKNIEAFYSFRINGANDFGDWTLPPVLKQHPEWGIPSPYWPKPWKHFNFTLEEVRQYKLSIIREVAERYDFDGIEIDWRGGLTTLPPMQAWENRNSLTKFMRSVREMLQELAEQRGRPYLLAVRIPENIEGCHYDGIHVERWVKENLVDILALGCKSFEVDLDAFRKLTEGTPIKLYPSMDDHHRASGYEQPTIEVYRGAASSFHHQGADGIYVFNWYSVPAITDTRWSPQEEQMRRQALCEMGSPNTLFRKDKTFVTQRRGGGGWSETAEYYYANTSAFAQLPKELSNNPSEDTYVFMRVGDDLNTLAEDVDYIELRVLLSDPSAADLPWEDRIHGVPVRIAKMSSRDFNDPPAQTLVDQLRVNINGVILNRPAICDGWLIYLLKPVHLAFDRNVIAFNLTGRNPDIQERITVEKLEINVLYTT